MVLPVVGCTVRLGAPIRKAVISRFRSTKMHIRDVQSHDFRERFLQSLTCDVGEVRFAPALALQSGQPFGLTAQEAQQKAMIWERMALENQILSLKAVMYR